VQASILAPAAVLIAWTLLMLLWMAATRIAAMAKLGYRLTKLPPGGRGQDLEPKLPPAVAWKAHNHTHLFEQPTIFYACVIILALSGAGSGVNTMLAWGYVGLRICHSLWQALINILWIRFTLFVLATLCLIGLAGNAVRITLAM
jgi:hypothetical protein